MSAEHEERDTNGSFDTSGKDRVTLSARERQTLAHLEERIRLEDPDFFVRMRGRSWRWVREVAAAIEVPEIPAWMGPVLFVVGLVATVLVVGSLPWLSLLTVGSTVLGAVRIGRSVGIRIERIQRPQGTHEPD